MELCKCEDPRLWERSDGAVQCERCACLSPDHDQPDCLHVRTKWEIKANGSLLTCIECGDERLIVPLSQR
jgi:hypothetical protein